MILKKIKLVFFVLVTLNVSSQNNYPTDYFISPIDIPIKLAGTFGELRSNHFHSGIDIKTGEQTGLNIYAIADGYVSRIKIQPGAYGKALYITHPNGYVSVFGHLSRFNEVINNYVIEKQYQQKSYEVDLYPAKGELSFKKGDIIAYSGNTGRSAGPHLHFEIRTEADQKPVNPLLFGYNISDNTSPSINLLKIYPYGSKSVVKGKNTALDFYPVVNGNQYRLKNNEIPEASGSVYFGINTIDLFYGGLNKNGVYRIEVKIDNKPFYAHKLQTFSFDETRYINSLIDYKEYKTKGRQVQLTYVQPNNKLSIYEKVDHHGILELNPNQVYNIEIEVSDASGNKSNLIFKIKGIKSSEIQKRKMTSSHQIFNYKGNNVFKNEQLIFEVPGNALYDTLDFIYSMLPAIKRSYSPLHQLHHDFVPLQTWCTLSIKADSLPESLRSKALIALVDDNEIESAGGQWTQGYVSTQIRDFGKYCVVVDTVPPQIKPVNIRSDRSLLAQKTIMVKIMDELSGIKTYVPTLNGEWILMEYDAKNDLLIYTYDSRLKEGENNFKLEVWDEKNNYSVYDVVLHY